MRKSTMRAAAIGVAALALVGLTATAASAAPKPDNSAGNFFLAGGDIEGAIVAPGATLDFDYPAIGRPDDTADGVENRFPASAEVAETVTTFIAPRGSELTPSAWLTTGLTGFFEDTKEVWLPSVSLASFTDAGTSSIDAVKAAGGDYSLGFAYLKNNGLAVVANGAYFTYISITPVTGAWTFETPSGDTPPPVDPTLSGDVDLEATTIAGPPPVDGTLNLTVPAAAKVTFGAASLVDGLSTSTGALPAVTVQDDRNASKPGWKLTASVSDFAGPSAAVIEKKQLGMAPAIVSGTTGAVAGATLVAGSAVWDGTTVASAPAAAGTGTTVVGANLTFVAPADKPVGTYTSKMTLTLVSE